MRRADIGALLAFALLGWHRAAADRAGGLGRLAFYWLILLIFWALWRATPLQELGRPGLDAARLFWYMAVTECVVIAVGFPYREIERAILSGEIAIPVAVIPAMVLSTAIATLLVLLCHLQLGYAAAWVGSPAPLFWIWQKMTFVLGGLMIPLALYPEPFGSLAEASPFAAMIFAPASFLLDASSPAIAGTLGLQLLWLIVIGLMTWLVERAAAARFAERGI